MRFLLLVTFTILLGACATSHSNIYSQDLQGCLNQLAAFKHEVNRQQVNDAQVVNHKAFPYLAFDRFSQSQLYRLSTQRDREQWLDYTAQLATHQRQAEYSNLIVNRFDLATLDSCAEKLVTAAKHNNTVWTAITEHPIAIADSYEPWLRVFGLYPISSQVAQSSINTEKRRILAGFNEPTNETTHYQLVKESIGYQSPLTQPQIAQWFNEAIDASTINWPQLNDDQISQLYQHYSPLIKVETVSDDDIPGTVHYVDSQQKPAVNAAKPAIYLHHSYTQLYGKAYLQLNYSLWFANRTATSSLDPYAGKFDGILLRLTLDHQGRPLLLDSIHHCGCYHMVFNFSKELAFANANPDTESPLIFQRTAPKEFVESIPALSITLSHGEHMIKQVEWLKEGDLEADLSVLPLVGHSYNQLRQLPTERHHTVSLFDQAGMLPSSERLESTYLWPFGIPSAGAMRQVGHHAIAFIGTRHFDEPRLFEQILRPATQPQN